MPEQTWIHAFTDGRDVSPHAAVNDLATLPGDRILTGVLRNESLRRVRVDLPDVRVLARDGDRVNIILYRSAAKRTVDDEDDGEAII